MGLEVMNYVAAAIKGDFKKVVDLSMECVMCGVCASRCPAEISPFNIALLVRRLFVKYLTPTSPQLKNRLKEVEEGKFKNEFEELKLISFEELRDRFNEYQTK
jgi:heterodisulfide reductase subunit C